MLRKAILFMFNPLGVETNPNGVKYKEPYEPFQKSDFLNLVSI